MCKREREREYENVRETRGWQREREWRGGERGERVRVSESESERESRQWERERK